MTVLEALILGIIQGLTEFLPISSSGHLVAASYFFGIEEGGLSFSIILHVATAMAIIVVYWGSVLGIAKEFFLMLFDIARLKGPCLSKSKYRKYAVYIIIASIPAAFVGILLEDFIDGLFKSIYVIPFTFFLTAVVLAFSNAASRENTTRLEDLGAKKSLLVGCFQALAIVPGLSRSGTTLAGGLFLGLMREEALELSFLMAVPAILGSLLLDIAKVFDTALSLSLPVVLAGFISSTATGCLSIVLFKKMVKKNMTYLFCAYLVLASCIVLILA
ncbi:MAG: undecaprenyl-diphosphate phosphatase [Eubacteriaceae bacterium]|nr:undecaprenyl-diphosphate phosphatase [Eubacteriaceae bacterium]